MRRAVPLLLLCLLAAAPAAADKGGHDEDDLRVAVKRGEALPLKAILEVIRPVTGDNIVEIEPKRRSGRLMYDIYYIRSDGRRREIRVDARDGAIIDHGKDD
ncbi:MAG: PepSY domain-containing protein [Rhizobiaceae bacterium]